MGNLSWQTIFIIAVGILLLYSGLSNFGSSFKIKKRYGIYQGKVQKSVPHALHDKKGRLVQHYWDLDIRYKKDNQIVPARIKSSSQYDKGETVYVAESGDKVLIADSERASSGIGISLVIAGLGVIAAPYIYKHAGMIWASLTVVAILVLIGLALFLGYLHEKPGNLEKINGTITDLLLYQTDRETRMIASPKHWYPLITYERNGEKREYLSKISSNYQSSFKTGESVQLYFDPERNCIVEKKPATRLIVMAVILWSIAFLGCISTLMSL
ncbi:MAG: hypothetical protein ACI4W2_02980 [Eubacterium sp.]